MQILYKNKNRIAMTLLEVLIAMSILGLIGTLFGNWFTQNSRYQKRLTKQNDADNLMRNILWEIHKDLKTSRTILYPRLSSINSDSTLNIISDSKLVVRDFEGNILSYYYKKETKEVIKQTINFPIPNAKPNEKKVLGKDIDCLVFTNRNELNNLVGIYMESGPSVQIDSIYLMNY